MWKVQKVPKKSTLVWKNMENRRLSQSLLKTSCKYMYIIDNSRTLLICKKPSKVLHISICGYKYRWWPHLPNHQS